MGDTSWERVVRWLLVLLLVAIAPSGSPDCPGAEADAELRGVRYRYAGYAKTVLHDIDLTLTDGSMLGVVGRNESGKSTLCLVASGLRPDRSAVR